MKKILGIIVLGLLFSGNAYATRFPNHENIKRIQEWANADNLNTYQIGFLYHHKNIGKTKFNDASWTVVEANCHFLRQLN